MRTTFGPTYKASVDGARLSAQHERIRNYMLGVEWKTLDEIQRDLERMFHSRFPVASISAQLRHLRKKPFGSFRLEKRHRGAAGWGLWEYRLLPPVADAEVQADLFVRSA